MVDGYGVRIAVNRGRLVIDDGLGAHRQQRELSRIERTVRRIVIVSDTGTVTLDAVRWCADVGISIVQVDREGRVLSTSGAPGTDDARLRRAQAAAPNSDTGLEISRSLLAAKLAGQARNLRDALAALPVAIEVERLNAELAQADGLAQLRDQESLASNAYFAAWSAYVTCSFAERDRARVPGHWLEFSARRSPLHTGHSPRSATNPVNALLNYAYGLAEVECRLALIRVGLDSGMGIMHTDRKYRDSLALDLLEPLRPLVEQQVLQLVSVRHFTAADFHETRTGVCRLMPALTEELSAWLPTYTDAVAPIAESVAHALARSSPGKIIMTTPLSRSNTAGAQTRGNRTANRREKALPTSLPSCRTCGSALASSERRLCDICWPVTRSTLATARAATGQASLQARRAAGDDPAQTVEARARRRRSLLDMKAAEAAWNATGSVPPFDETFLDRSVLPSLAELPLSKIQEATGLSVSACSQIRSGKRRPHPRHWQALGEVVGVLNVGA